MADAGVLEIHANTAENWRRVAGPDGSAWLDQEIAAKKVVIVDEQKGEPNANKSN